MLATVQLHSVARAATPAAVRANLWVVDGAAQPSACDVCRLNALCIPEGLAAHERATFTGMIVQRRMLQSGEALHHAGDPFTNLYFVKTGAFKTVVLLDDGREQITGFHLAGDMLGIDAISYRAHASDAIALEEARVCAIAFSQLSHLSRASPPVQDYLHRKLAREVVRDQELMLLLGRMHADERVAAFLQNLSRRFQARGCSPHLFTLPMAREDIGNYLGLTLETVSRCFSRLKNAGVIEVDNRRIRILDSAALRDVVGSKERTDA